MASCKLVERLLPLLCLALLAQLAAAMRCRVPYEKVQQNYCYYISDVKQEQVSSQACQAFEWDFSVMPSPFCLLPWTGDLVQQPVLPGQAHIACVPRQR